MKALFLIVLYTIIIFNEWKQKTICIEEINISLYVMFIIYMFGDAIIQAIRDILFL